MFPPIPAAWRPQLAEELKKPYFQKLKRFLDEQRRTQTIYPAEKDVFAALELTSFDRVKVLLLGQDPYPGAGQAHGLSFSVRPHVPLPMSLRNIYKELQTDVGFRIPNNGYLVSWAQQGVLLLNAVLTVCAGETNSHQGKGWEQFTDAVISKVNDKENAVVFVLWGNYAQKKQKLIDARRHVIIKGAHPSPLSARRGFFGSKPFSAINKALRAHDKAEIDWQIPDV